MPADPGVLLRSLQWPIFGRTKIPEKQYLDRYSSVYRPISWPIYKGLKLLFEKGDRRKVQSDYADKIERILARLEEASEVGNTDLPGFRLHPLKGDLAGFWSVTVSGNRRPIFRSEGGHASDVDLIDYH